MNKKILVVAFAGLSLAAYAQSQGSKNEQSEAQKSAGQTVTSPRDASSGLPTGKRQHQPVTFQKEISAAREQSTGQATGKTTASDDWQAPTAKSTSGTPAGTRVATGDVNGDGKADLKTTKGGGASVGKPKNAVLNNSDSSVKSPRDLATGQASGK